MNYNQHMTPDIPNQGVNKLTYMLSEQLRKLLDKTAEQDRPPQEEKSVDQPQNRTSEDDRLEFLGYNY